MKHVQNAILVLVGWAAVSTVQAGGDSGFYFGGGVGRSNVDASLSNPGLGSFSFDGNDTGFKVIAGYNLGLVPFVDIAVEGAYVDFGTPDGSAGSNSGKVDISGFDAFALAGVSLGLTGWFAKVGVIRWDNDSTFNGVASSDSGTDAAFGVGMRLQLFSFSVRGEYELFEADNTDVSLFSVSGLFTF